MKLVLSRYILAFKGDGFLRFLHVADATKKGEPELLPFPPS